MSILIKGVEMPTTCGNCWFCHSVGNRKWHCRLTGKSFASCSVGWGEENNTGENGQHPYIRRYDCPLIPVPPHGRLIDADALHYCRIRIAHPSGDIGGWNAVVMSAEINNAPTIIPAEEAKDTNVPTYDLLYEEGGAGTT